MKIIIDCLICCKQPEWGCWEIGNSNNGKNHVKLWCLTCNDGKHFISTSYWLNKEDAICEWNNLMEDIYSGDNKKLGILEDKGFFDKSIFY